jgi:hypothetical protein
MRDNSKKPASLPGTPADYVHCRTIRSGFFVFKIVSLVDAKSGSFQMSERMIECTNFVIELCRKISLRVEC